VFCFFSYSSGDSKEQDEKPKSRPLPPWKRDLIEKNKKVARVCENLNEIVIT